MQKEQLIEILKQNGVKFNKALLSESVAGYTSDENAEYALVLYEDLFRLAEYGVQFGFGKVKGKIKEISDLIAPLISGTSYVFVSLKDTETKRLKILKGVEELNRSINMDMKDQLMKNLDDCIAVADAITSFRGDDKELCENLAKSKAVLLSIKSELENVADVSSREAAECQARAFEILMDWRKAVSRYQCYSDSVKGLDAALEKVKEWRSRTSVGRGRAKADEDYYTYDPKYDDVSGIVSAAHFAERTKGLKNMLVNYRNSTALLYNVAQKKAMIQEAESGYFAERDRLNARIKELSDESDRVLTMYQNGEMDAVVADAKCSDYEAEIARCEDSLQAETEDYEYRISGLRQDLADAEEATRIRNRLAQSFEDFVQTLDTFRITDPAKFVLFCSRLNFEDVYDAFSGRLSAERTSELFTTIQAITTVVENEIITQRRTAREFVAIRDRSRAAQREKLLEEQEREKRARERNQPVREVGTDRLNRVKSTEEASKKSMEERLRARNLAAGKPTEGDKNPQESADGTIHVGNDEK